MPIDINTVRSRILEIRGQQVLLDRDVAALYGVETKVLNQAVKRNRERFYDGYILTLTAEECSRSQIVTLKLARNQTRPTICDEDVIWAAIIGILLIKRNG